MTGSGYPWAGAETSAVAQQLFAADRSREECLNPLATTFEIERRDLRQRFRVLASEKAYYVLPLFDLATAQEKVDFQCSGRHWRKAVIREIGNAGRELKITFTYQSTGGERPMFDCVARHRSVRRRDERDRKFGGNWTEAVTDAWYFDSQQLAARFAGFSGHLVHHAFGVLKLSDYGCA